MEHWKKDKLEIKKYTTRQEMGAGAAADAEKVIAKIIEEKGYINMIFAAAPSQNEMLQSLLNSDHIDWSKVNAMHMDEYVGLPEGSAQSFVGQQKITRQNVRAIRQLCSNTPWMLCAWVSVKTVILLSTILG